MQAIANEAIAILEDDALLRCAIAITLEAQGFEVVVGSTGSDVAGQVAGRGLQPTLIITDYRLGTKTALDEIPEVMAALAGNVTVVVTTGDTSSETRTLIEKCGWHLLIKPYRPQDLLSIIAAV